MRKSPRAFDANQRRRRRAGAAGETGPTPPLSLAGASCWTLTALSAMRPPDLLEPRCELIDERQEGRRQSASDEDPRSNGRLHQLRARQVDDEKYDGERGGLPENCRVVTRGGGLADKRACFDRLGDGQQ